MSQLKFSLAKYVRDIRTHRQLLLRSLNVLLILALVFPGGGFMRDLSTSLGSSFSALNQAGESTTASPMMFVENVGQLPLPADMAPDAAPRFQVRGEGGSIYLAPSAIWVTLLETLPLTDTAAWQATGSFQPISPRNSPREGVNLRISFVGANANPRITPFGPLDTSVSYYMGDDPDKWYPDVPAWAGVRYEDIYAGFDLEIASAGDQWQWRLRAQPGADLV